MHMTFQENLRFYRINAGYRQAKDFAAAIGVNYSTYMAYENQGKEPKYETLLRIAEALNVSIDTLLGFPGADRYEEFKRLVIAAGYPVEERNDGFVILSVSHTELKFEFQCKMEFCYWAGKTLEKLDKDITAIKSAYIDRAVSELFNLEK